MILSFDWLMGFRMLMAFLPRKTQEDSDRNARFSQEAYKNQNRPQEKLQ